MSGFGRPEDKQRSAQAGFELHLVKPVDPAVLMRVLAEAPQARARPAQSVSDVETRWAAGSRLHHSEWAGIGRNRPPDDVPSYSPGAARGGPLPARG